MTSLVEVIVPRTCKTIKNDLCVLKKKEEENLLQIKGILQFIFRSKRRLGT